MKAIASTFRVRGCCSLWGHHHDNAIEPANVRIPRRNVHLVRPFRFSKKMAKCMLRIAATADLHYGKHSRGVLHEAFAEISRSADVLLLCGDLTEYGLPDEAEALVADIRAAVRIPLVAVLGNHDFESGHPKLLCRVLDDAGMNVLNAEAIEIAGVGFAGISGAAVSLTG